ncbi:MAG: trigger factor, partial [Phycisphaerales bacterium]|nr:trigger factor [Phycisphaerales bacterium]
MTTQATANRVSVTDAGPALKRIQITIPASRVAEHIESQFGSLAKTAVMAGFRAGHAPRSLLQKRYGPAVLEEAKKELFSTAVNDAVKEHKLQPLGQPIITKETADCTLSPSQDFSLEVEVEVVPEFTLPAWEGLALQRPVIDVLESHVDDEIRRSSYRFGIPTRIDGPFEKLDRLVGRAVVHIEDAEAVFFETDKALAVVPSDEDGGKGQFLGLLIDDLEATLLGRKTGDVVVMNTVGPEAHELEAVRGKKLRIDYTIREAERITPATNEELLAKSGIDTIELMREQVKMILEKRRDEEQRGALREQVFEQLAAAVDFPLPERLSAAQAERDLERARMELTYRGLEADKVEARLAAMRGATTEQSRARLKLFFILAKLAETLAVEATEGEVNGRIAAIARGRNLRPDAVRTELEKAGRIGEVVLQIREAKAADRVIGKATVTDIDALEWNKQIEAKMKSGASVSTAPPAASA